MNNSIHLLLFAVVQEQDQDSATRALEQLRVPVVRLASAGGFLGRRNTTLLVGLKKGREEDALNAKNLNQSRAVDAQIIKAVRKQCCPARCRGSWDGRGGLGASGNGSR